MSRQIGVIGAGSWGTALAMVLADNGHEVDLWTRKEQQAEEINEAHANHRYLPERILSDRIVATTSIEQAVKGKQAVLLVTPSHVVREVSSVMIPFLSPDTVVIHAVKGIEMDTLQRMSEVIYESGLSTAPNRLVVLSGPSHAEEVSLKSPTTVVVASENEAAAQVSQDLLINSYFRVYTNSDVVGVELGGALKNIIALGAGLSDGLGFGDNAKAALLTRGLAEITRLGVAMGANPLTFSGLAGVGDLIVTCTSRHSRNWRAGYSLGQGKSLQEVLKHLGMVVEGVKTTKAAYILAQEYDIQMPITKELYRVLFEGKNPKTAVEDLMGRGKTQEIENV
jgi:glycerol-3-phosphate dehydrogenase (NAD(P)+)